MRKMKDSDIEWIGEIPEGWKITRLKYLADFEPTCDTSYLTDESKITYTPMECVKNGGFENRSALYGNLSHTLTPFQNGDIAMAKVTPCFENGNIAIMDNLFSGFGLGSSELFIFRPKGISTHYFFYWLQNKAFVAKACSTMTGTGGLKRISPSFIRNCPVHCPSMDEQTKISDYLEAKCSEIDTMLSKNRSSIEEYKKLKQAVITQAVTKGVRGEREMKDSGVEWADLVPLHWGVAKIGSIGQTSSGATPLRSKEASFFDDATIRWVRTLDLNDGLVYDSSQKITELALASSACSIMPKGTVCVAMYGGAGTIGKCGLLMSDCATNQAVCSIVCNRKIVSPIFLLMQLLALKPYWMKYAVGTRKDPNISQDVVARMKILIPPLDEQKEITDYLDAKCAEIDGLIAKKEQLVKELESYKKSLIYEVVTGKREVQNGRK